MYKAGNLWYNYSIASIYYCNKQCNYITSGSVHNAGILWYNCKEVIVTNNVILLLQGDVIYTAGILRYFVYKECRLNCSN